MSDDLGERFLNSGDDVILRSDQFKNPEREDRLSLVLNAAYVQWDSPPIHTAIRLGRLIPESRTPVVLSKYILPKDKEMVLDFSSIMGAGVQYELLMVNKTKVAPDTDILRQPWVSLWLPGSTSPFKLRPDRLFYGQSIHPLKAIALHTDAVVTIYGFPE